MQLAKFDSEAEQTYFMSILDSDFEEIKIFWLAGNDIVKEGIWKWAANDVPINIKLDWAPGEPNDMGGAENCLQARVRNKLNDANCNVENFFMCQEVYEK